MKKLATVVLIVYAFFNTAVGQSISKSDSIKVVKASTLLFEASKDSNFAQLKKVTDNKIYCDHCSDSLYTQNGLRGIPRKEFYTSFLSSITNYLGQIEKHNEYFVFEQGAVNVVSVFWTIYKKDEYSKGHEGGQLVLDFKKVAGEFKLISVGVIP